MVGELTTLLDLTAALSVSTKHLSALAEAEAVALAVAVVVSTQQTVQYLSENTDFC